MRDKKIVKLTLAGMFAALAFCCFSYLRIEVPMGLGLTGKIYIGHAFLILSALVVGARYGALSGAVGLTLAVAAIVMVALALVLTKPMVKILQINRKVLMPIIVSLTVVGAYASRSNLFDVKLMLVFGLIGFFLRKMNFPLAPLTLGLILGKTADTNFRQSLTMGGNVLTRVVGDILLVVVIYSLVSGTIKTVKGVKTDLGGTKQ